MNKVEQLLGTEVMWWLIRAGEQNVGKPVLPCYEKQTPRAGYWRDTGWHRGVGIVLGAFQRQPMWVQIPNGTPWPTTTFRWDADPFVFLCELEAEMIAEQPRLAAEAGELNFHGATGAFSCCIAAVRKIKQAFCNHQFSSPFTVGGYTEPEETMKRCERCGLEVEAFEETQL